MLVSHGGVHGVGLNSKCRFLLAPADKISFNVRLTLIPTESWIQCGSFLDLCYSQRTICVKIDPTGLAPGVHKARYLLPAICYQPFAHPYPFYFSVLKRTILPASRRASCSRFRSRLCNRSWWIRKPWSTLQPNQSAANRIRSCGTFSWCQSMLPGPCWK